MWPAPVRDQRLPSLRHERSCPSRSCQRSKWVSALWASLQTCVCSPTKTSLFKRCPTRDTNPKPAPPPPERPPLHRHRQRLPLPAAAATVAARAPRRRTSPKAAVSQTQTEQTFLLFLYMCFFCACARGRRSYQVRFVPTSETNRRGPNREERRKRSKERREERKLRSKIKACKHAAVIRGGKCSWNNKQNARPRGESIRESMRIKTHRLAAKS